MIELQIYLYAALFFSMTGYAIYWYGLRKQLVRPNRFSWLIWSAVTTVEALTYQAVNEGLVQNLIFFVSAASCLFITIAIWRDSSSSRPTRLETLSMVISLAALATWLLFQAEIWAHLLVVAAIPISFVPTLLSARKDARWEASPAWGFWTMADIFTLLLILRSPSPDPMELPYVVVETICQSAIWMTIGLASINPLRMLASQGYRADPSTFCGNPASAFEVGYNDKGLAVFARMAFPRGAELLEMGGKRSHISQILAHREGSDDRFMQIDTEMYIGPSGNIDDLLNHSCDPNCGLKFLDERIVLVALKPIQSGDELCFDYSTTSSASQFSMRCQCGAEACRDVIGDFELLDPEIQLRYLKQEVVPPYLQRRFQQKADLEQLAA